MRRSTLWAPVAVVLVVGLAGCSGRSDDGDPAAAENQPSDEQSLTASERYLELVTPYNCAFGAAYQLQQDILFDGTGVDERNWDEARRRLLPAYAAVADASKVFADGLMAERWPKGAQGPIDELVKQLDLGAVTLRSMADASSIDDFVFWSEEFTAARNGSNPATAVRSALGLETDSTDAIAACPTAS